MLEQHYEKRRNPFPGLRPFQEDEDYLFFGRENQIDSMINILAQRRFLAVVGTSGSGKSSLINCGLEPALHQGLLSTASGTWRIVKFRPSDCPIKAMAQALAKDGALFRDFQGYSLTLPEMIESTLRLSSIGLLDVVEQASRKESFNLLLVADQFEELFRYRRLGKSSSDLSESSSQEATAFTRLLLEVFENKQEQIHIALTMRSDFLGDCTQFEGLAEAINQSLYLVPRLTREERREAIANPVLVEGAEITPTLVTRLVNDVGDNPDQLSILQHALNRTWSHWQAEGSHGPLDLPHYEAIGTMAEALDRHAEEAYSELADGKGEDGNPSTAQQLCCRLFQAITDKASDGRGIRRPTKVGTLIKITGASVEDLVRVIEVFRQPCRSFLMPPAGTDLCEESVIDISHESLMRVWRRLSSWADVEARWAEEYRRLARTAELHQQGNENYLRDPALQLALDWWNQSQPNEAWALRYHPGFDAAHSFLEKSEQSREEERRRVEEEYEQAEKRREEEREHERTMQEQKLRQARFKQHLSLASAVISLLVAGWIYTERREAYRQVGRIWKAIASGLVKDNQVDPGASLRLAIASLGRIGDSPQEVLEIGVTLNQALEMYGEKDASHDNTKTKDATGTSIVAVGPRGYEKLITPGSTDSYDTINIWDGKIDVPRQKIATALKRIRIASLGSNQIAISGDRLIYDGKKREETLRSVVELWRINPASVDGKSIVKMKPLVPESNNGLIGGISSLAEGNGLIVYYTYPENEILFFGPDHVPHVNQVDGKINTAILGGTSGVALISVTKSWATDASKPGNFLELWDLREGRFLSRAPVEARIDSLLLLKNGYFLSGDYDGFLQLWDPKLLTEFGPRMKSQPRTISSLAQVRSTEIVAGSADGTLRRWNYSRQGLQSIGLSFPANQGNVTYLLSSTDSGLLFSSGSNGSLKKWRWESVPNDHIDEELNTGQYEVVHASPLNNGMVFRVSSRNEETSLNRGNELQKIVEYANINSANGRNLDFQEAKMLSKENMLGKDKPPVLPSITSLLAIQGSKSIMPDLLSGHIDGSLRLWRFNNPNWEHVYTMKSKFQNGKRGKRVYALAGIGKGYYVASQDKPIPGRITEKGYLVLFEIDNSGRLLAKGDPCRPLSVRDKPGASANLLNDSIFGLASLKDGGLITGYRNGMVARWKSPLKQWCDTLSLQLIQPQNENSDILSLAEMSDGSIIGSRGTMQLSIWGGTAWDRVHPAREHFISADPDANIYTRKNDLIASLARLPNNDIIATDFQGETRVYPGVASGLKMACGALKDTLEEAQGLPYEKEAQTLCNHPDRRLSLLKLFRRLLFWESM